MFSKKKTPKSKTPNSRIQPSAPHLTPDPNFQLSGVSPPIRFRYLGFEYTLQLLQSSQNNNIFYQNRPFNPPYNNPNAFHNSPTGLYRPTIESSTSSQPNQPYSPINPTNLDMNFEELLFSQEYNYSQEYSMGRGSGHGSAHGLAHGSVPIHDDEDDSPIEEVSPVKPKNPLRRAAKAKKDKPNEAKEAPKEWTVAKEIVLCQAWCDVSKNNIDGNNMKAKGFWEAVIRYFVKKTGSSKGYDSIFSKWKNRVRPRIEYKMMYKRDFTLEHCYNILKDHPGWKTVEMPSFYQSQGRKKSKTSETTSGSASGGLNLNEEADETVEETQEFRPMSRDRAKAKKKAAGSSRG
ncbi:40S ribosomal protein S20-2 [Tanacetum coccineum]